MAREAQLWQSIFSESEPVEGRPEVFQWRGRVLQQPQMTADGLCVIVEEATGSIVFKGLPPVAPDGAPATGPGAAGAGAAAVNEAAPPLPSFLQQDEPARSVLRWHVGVSSAMQQQTRDGGHGSGARRRRRCANKGNCVRAIGAATVDACEGSRSSSRPPARAA